MSTALKQQAREARVAIDAKEKKASEAFAAVTALKKSAEDEGVNFATDVDAFNRLDEAYKTYDGLKDEIAHDTKNWARLVEMAADGDPSAMKSIAELGRPAPQGDPREGRKSVAERFTESPLYTEIKDIAQIDGGAIGNTRATKVGGFAEAKTLLTTSAGGSALFRNDRLDTVVMLPQPPTNLLDVLPVNETDSDTVEWVLEQTFTNAAAETAEGSDSPESTEAFTTATTPVREITHSLPVTKKMLADAPALRGYLDLRMNYGVRKRLQAQVISGDATGQNLRGLSNVVGILTQARGADSRVDAVHKAMTKIRINAEDEATPTHVLIHPTDYETVRLEKDANGNYYYGGPAGNAGFPTLWGLIPIVTTQATVGTPIVIDVNVMSLFLREGLTLAASDSHSDFFIKRQVMLLATLRAAFAVFQPKGVATVTSF